MEYHILKNIPDLHKKEKGLYISSPISQEGARQSKTDAAAQDEKHVSGGEGFTDSKK